MAPSEPSGASALALEQLIALDDEIAALVRMGVPVERAIGVLGEDMPGRLGETPGATCVEAIRSAGFGHGEAQGVMLASPAG